MSPQGIRTTLKSVVRMRISASNLTWRLNFQRNELSPDLGRPKLRLLLFAFPSLKREATIAATPFRRLHLERS